MAGLTAAAYLSKAGHDVLLIEKNNRCGGLVNSFQQEGFVFDAGARSILNSGIIRPMFADLGIEMELLDSPVSLGIENDIINFTRGSSLGEYQALLEKLYPENTADIHKIISKVKSIVKDMAILYGIDNPIFKDLKNDKKYLMKELLPWLGKFMGTLFRINRQNEPVESVLGKLTSNRSLIEIISQHFFKKTPTFFALGYFYVYTDYLYPKGGTGEIQKVIARKIIEQGGKIQLETAIVEVNPSSKVITDANGNSYFYDHLIWSADLKSLYRIVKASGLKGSVSRDILKRKDLLLSKKGAESVFTLFVGVDEPLDTFRNISRGHFFYTPSKKGLGDVFSSELELLVDNRENISREQVLEWLDRYCRLTTYEISIPAMRDASLAPQGKTGLVISMLFDYRLMKSIQDAGWGPEFKVEIENRMLSTLSSAIYPGLNEKVRFRTSSTPLSIEKVSGTSEGSIVGWSYEASIPAVQKLQKIADAPRTPIPNVYQAGQWAYSPAGIPTAILTGWYAAQKIMKRLK